MTEQTKTKAEWLREFVDAMEADPEGWWREYEIQGKETWRAILEPSNLTDAVFAARPIRRKPRTVTRFDRHGEPVELPEPMREKPKAGDRYWICAPVGAYDTLQSYRWQEDGADGSYFTSRNCFATQTDAQAWADYFKSLLETRDD